MIVCAMRGSGLLHTTRKLLGTVYPSLPRPPPPTRSSRAFHVAATEPDTQYLQIKYGASGGVREVAYMKTEGSRDLGLIYIPGFMAHKAGAKAQALHTFAQENGFPYVRYDPSGLGESRGVHKTEAYFSLWLEDATNILQQVTKGPQIIVASSMGGWIASLLASQIPEKLAGVVLLAPAVNFNRRYEKVLLSQLPPEALKLYKEGGVVNLYAPDYGEFPLKKLQFDQMKEYELNLEKGQIELTCPVRIIHGMKDKDVPYRESLTLAEAIQSPDLKITYLKSSGHTLKDDTSLQVIFDTILRLAQHLKT